MTKEKKELETWEEVIVDFFEYNISSSNLYKARDYINKKNKEIGTEKDESKKTKLIEKKNVKLKKLDEDRRCSSSTEIPKWLDENSNKSGSIKKATHLLRFTHSSSVADGVLLTEKSEDEYLTTSSLSSRVYDMAHNNGNLVSVSRFLALEKGATSIFDEIAKEKFNFLEPFSKDEVQIKKWIKGFKKLVVNEVKIRTVDKAKQIYFPLSNVIELDDNGDVDNKNYHLIAPLFSSSLAEELYSQQKDFRFGEEQKTVRQAKKGGYGTSNISPHYHRKSLIEFTYTAVQKFGGAQPQNVSMLNKGRTWKANKKDKTTWGITYLFNSQPPIWQSQLKPPLYKKSLFDTFSHPSINVDIDYLRDYLLRFERIELSIKNPQRLKWIEKWLASIIDELLNYAATIQALPAGWSNAENSKLKLEHQYFLDPCRPDEIFQNARKASHWQNVVCNDFSRWLNRKLVGKDKKFTPQPEHTRLWATLLEQPLREYNQMIEADTAIQDKVQA